MKSFQELEQASRAWLIKRQRQKDIYRTLPEAIDLLTLVMQAGLDFQVALAHYLERAPRGPLREEFLIVQSEMRTGTSRADALRHLAIRVPCRDLEETAKAIIQGIELGSSLVPILRAQARALRKRRGLEAEKCAALAPLKLMAPLFIFIFPTLFVALFGPVILSVMQGRGQ